MECYDTYKWTRRELEITLLKGLFLLCAISVLFYQNLIFVILLSPTLLLMIREEKKKKIELRRWKLNLQFRDGLLSILAALDAGYAIENAFSEARKDLSLIYSDTDLIMKEFRLITHKLRMNQNIEEVLKDFGERSGVEDIICFAEIFQTAKRSGGDLVNVIRSTCSVISDKIEIKREIKTVITGKKMEADIMKLVPIGIIGYFLMTSPGFLEPLYHNAVGIIIMTILLVVYIVTMKIMDFITDINL